MDLTLTQKQVLRFTNLPTGTEYKIEEVYANYYQPAAPSHSVQGEVPRDSVPSNLSNQGYSVTQILEKNSNQTTEVTHTGTRVITGTISETDTRETADRMLEKMIKLRIFEDENGKTNLSLASVGGEVLLVSQFTLYADCRKGNRPSFIKAGSPKHAEELYEYLIEKCEQITGQKPQTGQFGALMKVHLTNYGPFTIIMDSEELGY